MYAPYTHCGKGERMNKKTTFLIILATLVIAALTLVSLGGAPAGKKLTVKVKYTGAGISAN
jgi:hypothetical protein